jgi:hypothetical protein
MGQRESRALRPPFLVKQVPALAARRDQMPDFLKLLPRAQLTTPISRFAMLTIRSCNLLEVPAKVLPDLP